MSEDKDQANFGIQAKNVKADVLAVGTGASATKNIGAAGTEELASALSELRAALGGLNLGQTAENAIAEDVIALEAAAAAPDENRSQIGDLLKQISEKLKVVGVVVKETASLVEPIKKIGALIGIGLSFL